MLKLKEQGNLMTKEEFESSVKAFRIKLDKNLVNSMAEEFLVPFGKRSTRVNVEEMADMYLTMYPTEPPPVKEKKKAKKRKVKKPKPAAK
jgi:hypothetical protein